MGLVLQVALPLRTEFPDVVGVSPRHIAATPSPVVGAYPQVVLASVFSPERTGAAAGKGAAAPAPAGIDAYAAVGVISGPRLASAVIRGPAGVSHVVRLGQQVAGWRLTGLSARGVSFTRNGERRTLALGAKAAASTNPPPSTGGAPGASAGEDAQ